MVSFAVGGLLGDVFLHLLPQTFVGEVHEEGARFVIVDEHRNTLLGLAMFFGFLAFITLEKAMRIMGAGHDHDHSHDSITITRKTRVEIEGHDEEIEEEDVVDEDESADVAKSTSVDIKKEPESKLTNRKVHAEVSDSYTIEETDNDEPRVSIKLSAYLNLIADFTHNITDGLAISASFYISKNVGATTCLAVFFHGKCGSTKDYSVL